MDNKQRRERSTQAQVHRRQNKVEFAYNFIMAVLIVTLGSAIIVAGGVALLTPMVMIALEVLK